MEENMLKRKSKETIVNTIEKFAAVCNCVSEPCSCSCSCSCNCVPSDYRPSANLYNTNSASARTSTYSKGNESIGAYGVNVSEART